MGEFDSVISLLICLTSQLANLEQSNFEINIEEKRWRKKKLEKQLEEARELQCNVERRGQKVMHSIEHHLGVHELELLRMLLVERQKLLSKNKELADKLRLCRASLNQLELMDRTGV